MTASRRYIFQCKEIAFIDSRSPCVVKGPSRQGLSALSGPPHQYLPAASTRKAFLERNFGKGKLCGFPIERDSAILGPWLSLPSWDYSFSAESGPQNEEAFRHSSKRIF
jgi:hypothetical protein